MPQLWCSGDDTWIKGEFEVQTMTRLYKLEVHPYHDETSDAASLLFDLN